MVDPLPNAFTTLNNPAAQQNNRTLNTLAAQLASGNRLINAAIDPASLAVSTGLNSEVSAIRGAVIPNLAQGVSNAQIIDGAQSSLQGLFDRASVLAVQAGSANLSDNERVLLDTEFQNITSEIGRIVGDTRVGGQQVLQNGANLDIRAGTGVVPAEDDITQTVTSLDPTNFAGRTFDDPISGATNVTVDLTALDIRTQDGADTALAALSSGREGLIEARTETGAAINRFQTASDFAQTQEIFQEAARSRLADLNVAQGISAFSSAQNLQQLQIGVQVQQNQTAGSFLRLLN